MAVSILRITSQNALSVALLEGRICSREDWLAERSADLFSCRSFRAVSHASRPRKPQIQPVLIAILDDAVDADDGHIEGGGLLGHSGVLAARPIDEG